MKLRNLTQVLALVTLTISAGCASEHMHQMQVEAAAEAAQTDAAMLSTGGAAEMSAEDAAAMEAMMGAWMQHMTPGKHHAHMMERAGTYDVSISYRQGPDMPAQTSHSRAVLRPVLNGLFLLEESESDEIIPDMLWNGMGFSGYDNTADKGVMVWMDNAGSGMYYAEGKCVDGCTKQIMEGTGTDAASGVTKHYRYITRDITANGMGFEIWERGANGKYWRMMRSDYTRVP